MKSICKMNNLLLFPKAFVGYELRTGKITNDVRSDIEEEKMELLFVIKIFQQLDDVHISVWSKRN